jgi:hypothetical protein
MTLQGSCFQGLLGEDELFVFGYLQSVRFPRMLDNQHARTAEKPAAFHGTRGRSVIAEIRRLPVPDRILITTGIVHDRLPPSNEIEMHRNALAKKR